MFSFEFLIIFISCFQPLLIGILVFVGVGRIFNKTVFNKLGSIRSKLSSFRFYECATYSRLSSMVVYGSQFFTIFLAFLVYDVDLIFILPSTILSSDYSIDDLVLLLIFILLFIAGMSYDKKNTNFSWKLN